MRNPKMPWISIHEDLAHSGAQRCPAPWLGALPLALHLGVVALAAVRRRKAGAEGGFGGKGAHLDSDSGRLNQAPRSDDAPPPLPPRNKNQAPTPGEAPPPVPARNKNKNGLGARPGAGLGSVAQPPPRVSERSFGHRPSTYTTSSQLSDRPGSSSRRAAQV